MTYNRVCLSESARELKERKKPCALFPTSMEAESSGVELKESVVVIEPRWLRCHLLEICEKEYFGPFKDYCIFLSFFLTNLNNEEIDKILMI